MNSSHVYEVSGATVSRKTYLAAVNRIEKLEAVLRQADQLFREALPKFNWGGSALDANAIRLLNEVPGVVRKAIS